MRTQVFIANSARAPGPRMICDILVIVSGSASRGWPGYEVVVIFSHIGVAVDIMLIYRHAEVEYRKDKGGPARGWLLNRASS